MGSWRSIAGYIFSCYSVTLAYLFLFLFVLSFVLVYIELQLRHVLVLFECVRGDSVYISYI